MNNKLTEYLEQLEGKRIAVIGIGVSNTPLIKLLLRNGCSVTALDKSDEVRESGLAEELESLGAQLILGPDYLKCLREIRPNVIFRTPGLRPDVPELLSAKRHNVVITSEMEAFFDVCPCKIVAVTGSDGKTTTTTIISELLKTAGRQVYVGGNIGTPLLAKADSMREGDFAVLELSSFQLMTMNKSPRIAVVTNLAPNHLDWHTAMSEYIEAKENIYRHQGPGDRVVLNADNEITRSFAEFAKGEVVFFSKYPLAEGWYFDGDAIQWVRNGETTEVVRASEVKLPGIHNIENFMAAFAAVGDIVGVDVCREVAKRFTSVEHRIELVRRLHGVAFYNDSIASSPSRTIAGLRSFGHNVILIAGGYDKKIPYDVLGPEITAHVKTLVLCGATAPKIRAAVENAPDYAPGAPDILEYDDFDEAVLAAVGRAEHGDVVFLSPASASFDKFKNFSERGAAFKKIIYGLE